MKYSIKFEKWARIFIKIKVSVTTENYMSRSYKKHIGSYFAGKRKTSKYLATLSGIKKNKQANLKCTPLIGHFN